MGRKERGRLTLYNVENHINMYGTDTSYAQGVSESEQEWQTESRFKT